MSAASCPLGSKHVSSCLKRRLWPAHSALQTLLFVVRLACQGHCPSLSQPAAGGGRRGGDQGIFNCSCWELGVGVERATIGVLFGLVWLEIGGLAQNQAGGANRRCWSMFPLARATHFGIRYFAPQPGGLHWFRLVFDLPGYVCFPQGHRLDMQQL